MPKNGGAASPAAFHFDGAAKALVFERGPQGAVEVLLARQGAERRRMLELLDWLKEGASLVVSEGHPVHYERDQVRAAIAALEPDAVLSRVVDALELVAEKLVRLEAKVK